MPLIASTDYVTLVFIGLGLLWAWSLGLQHRELREEMRAQREQDHASSAMRQSTAR